MNEALQEEERKLRMLRFVVDLNQAILVQQTDLMFRESFDILKNTRQLGSCGPIILSVERLSTGSRTRLSMNPAMTTFAAIDFETANYSPDSACAVGLVAVEGGRVVRREYHLIRPPNSLGQVFYLAFLDNSGHAPSVQSLNHYRKELL